MAVFVAYPLELIRVRMAFETRSSGAASATGASNGRPSFLRTISHIYNEGTVAPESSSPTAPKRLFQQYPILKFYRGFTVTVAGMVPYAGVSFLTWGYLRARFLPPPPTDGASKAPNTPLANLGFGAIAGALSQTASYPFEIVRRRMQVGGLTRPDSWVGCIETVKWIWARSGWRGFYVGLSIGYLKIVPMNAITFTVWQAGKNVLDI